MVPRPRRTPRARPDGVPHNEGYMVAAYIVAAVILVGYALSLYRRSRNR
jgi:hypothetical protein